MRFILLSSLSQLISPIHLSNMIRLFFHFIVAAVFIDRVEAQVMDPIMHSVYLIGDTGKDTIPSEALQLLAFESFDDTQSTIVFLGDNVYNEGNALHKGAKATQVATAKLTNQLALFAEFIGNIYMIPGNHDWSNGKSKGLKAVSNQQQLVDKWFIQNSSVLNRKTGVYFKEPGMPGPFVEQLSENVQLLLLDSQWWMQQDLFHPVKKGKGKNRSETAEIALKQLDSLLQNAESLGKLSIVAAHHPISTNGKHSHRREPIRFLFNYTPLHIFSWLGMNRVLREDLPQPRYVRYRKSVKTVLKKYKHVVYVSGHEHTMQYLRPDSLHLIVSGAGYSTCLIDRYKYQASFMDDLQPGFFKLTIHQSGNIYLHAFGVKERGEFWVTKLFKLKE